jgi:hypothetical protein
MFYALPQVMIGRGVTLISLPLALLMMVGWRLSIHWFLGHPELGERILIVGSGPFAVEIAKETLSEKTPAIASSALSITIRRWWERA